MSLETVHIPDLTAAWQVDYQVVQDPDGRQILPTYRLNSALPPDMVGDAGAPVVSVDLGQYLGNGIELRWAGRKGCKHCGESLSRPYGGGYDPRC